MVMDVGSMFSDHLNWVVEDGNKFRNRVSSALQVILDRERKLLQFDVFCEENRSYMQKEL